MAKKINTLSKDQVSIMPKIDFKSYEWHAQHANKFAFMTINDTHAAEFGDANSPKFSVYIGNGKEPFKSSDGKLIGNFDPRDVDQKTIAAQFHVTSLTNISLNKIITPSKAPLRNRSAIKGTADVVEMMGNEVIILNASAKSRNSNDINTYSPGGVHIFTGDRDSAGANPSQPMVLGDNLNALIATMNDRIDQVSKALLDLNTEVMLIRTGLTLHVHPPLAPPSPDLAAQFVPRFLTSDLKRTLNNVAETINNIIDQINTSPLSKSKFNITSQFNTVN